MPCRNDEGEYYIQCAGGRFSEEKPDHFGSGLILENGTKFKEELELDRGQYDKLGKLPGQRLEDVILEDFINKVGDLTQARSGPTTETWITARGREAGERIYQIPVRLFHHESKDTKRVKDDSKVQMETRNLQRLHTKWANTKFYKTLDREIKKWIKYLLKK